MDQDHIETNDDGFSTQLVGGGSPEELRADIQVRLNALVLCLYNTGVLDHEQYRRTKIKLTAESDQILAAFNDAKDG